MWTNDIRSVLEAIQTMKSDLNIKQSTLWLSHDLMEYYNNFKDEVLYQLGDNASIYIDGITNNPAHVVYETDGFYIVMYPLRESYPEQVMNISCYLSIEDYNTAMNF
jgi:hypothetical protein